MSQNAFSPSITIITVCLNSSATIERTLRSVIEQKGADTEYIVIDGGSTDGTQDIVRAFGEGVDLLVSEPDNGISDSFNKGIALASGEIIGLINSDDALLPGALQQVRDFLRNNPECQVVHGDLLLYSGDRFVKRVVPAGRWWYPWRLVLFNHPATFVRRSVYETHGNFSLEFRIAMDVEIFLRWLVSGVRIEYLPEQLAVMHYGGVSNRRPYDGYREVRRAYLEHGYQSVTVWLLYAAKCLLHNVGKYHASVMAFVKSSK